MAVDAKEHGEVTYKNKAGEPVAEMVSIDRRTAFILYDLRKGKRKKLGQGKNPKDLEEKYNVMRIMEEK